MENKSGWQDISTAPKDGTEIILFHKNWQLLPRGSWECIQGGEEDGSGAIYGWHVDEYFTPDSEDGIIWPDIQELPTHWSEIPEFNKKD